MDRSSGGEKCTALVTRWLIPNTITAGTSHSSVCGSGRLDPNSAGLGVCGHCASFGGTRQTLGGVRPWRYVEFFHEVSGDHRGWDEEVEISYLLTKLCWRACAGYAAAGRRWLGMLSQTCSSWVQLGLM